MTTFMIVASVIINCVLVIVLIVNFERYRKIRSSVENCCKWSFWLIFGCEVFVCCVCIVFIILGARFFNIVAKSLEEFISSLLPEGTNVQVVAGSFMSYPNLFLVIVWICAIVAFTLFEILANVLKVCVLNLNQTNKKLQNIEQELNELKKKLNIEVEEKIENNENLDVNNNENLESD